MIAAYDESRKRFLWSQNNENIADKPGEYMSFASKIKMEYGIMAHGKMENGKIVNELRKKIKLKGP